MEGIYELETKCNHKSSGDGGVLFCCCYRWVQWHKTVGLKSACKARYCSPRTATTMTFKIRPRNPVDSWSAAAAFWSLIRLTMPARVSLAHRRRPGHIHLWRRRRLLPYDSLGAARRVSRLCIPGARFRRSRPKPRQLDACCIAFCGNRVPVLNGVNRAEVK